jgi:hypothetical protein
MLPMAYWALGRRAESDAALDQYKKKYSGRSAYEIAEGHAFRNEADAAFEWLDRAYRTHNPGMAWLKVDPMLRNLHGDPRYQALLVKMKLDGNGRQVRH